MFIVAAFPGCGKSTLVKSHPAIADSDSSQFDKSGFPKNYLDHIQTRFKKQQCTLVSTHQPVREGLIDRDLPFILVYPRSTAKREYQQRYLNRKGFNGGEQFAGLIEKFWDQWIAECYNQTGCEHRVLQPGEFLADAIGFTAVAGQHPAELIIT